MDFFETCDIHVIKQLKNIPQAKYFKNLAF